jgi:AcrR family transcriptional regulator
MSEVLTPRQEDVLRRLTALITAEGFRHLTLNGLAERLHCSKTTLYALADSKEQLAVRAVNSFFRSATDLVESRVAAEPLPLNRIQAYVDAIAEAFEPVSRRFVEDLSADEATRRTYRTNARAAAERVRALVDEAAAAGDVASVDAVFVATWLGLSIEAIQRGDFAERAGLSDADAFGELSRMLARALALPASVAVGAKVRVRRLAI